MEPQSKKSKPQLRCEKCGKTFQHKHDMLRHIRNSHGATAKFNCPVCSLEFNRKDNLNRHLKRHVQTGGASSEQPTNRTVIQKPNAVSEDQREDAQEHQQPEVEKQDENTEQHLHEGDQQQGNETAEQTDMCDEQALGGTIRKKVIPALSMEMFDLMTFLKVNFEKVKKVLKDALRDRGALKWYLSAQVKMTRRQGNLIDAAEPHFRGKCQIALKVEDLEEALKETMMKIYNSFLEFQRRGSNWTLDKIKSVTIHMSRYRPLKGSSYIPLPIKLRQKNAVVNVQNKDNKCFMWSVLAALHPVNKNATRTSKYKDYEDKLNFKGIKFPVSMEDILKFEKQNDISINVFGYEKGTVFPCHVTNQRYQKHVDLLMIDDGKKSHYCWVKNRSRLLGDQHTHANRYHYCPYCLTGFTKARILKEHIIYCQNHGAQKIELPTEDDKWLYYKDVRKQLKVPYIIYADFESLQMPISGCSKDVFGTEKKTMHVPCGFAYKVVGLTPEHSKDLVVYRGLDAADKFVEYMIEEQEEIEQKFKNAKPLEMTGNDWKKFNTAIHCHICQKKTGKRSSP